MACCLITVVWGEVYERYAKGLFKSASKHTDFTTVLLRGVPGWPQATLYRYHAVLENAEDLQYEHLFLCDADMYFEAKVGTEILGEIVATQHPGYVTHTDFPYENRPESTAFVASGNTYYAGGFVGGEREAFLHLAERIAFAIDEDDKNGILARWHDESHLNRVLAGVPPTVMLSPSYCYPDDASGYPWISRYERKLVALDKSPAERRGR